MRGLAGCARAPCRAPDHSAVRGPLVFIPVLGAPALHAPVLALDLAPGLKLPLDGGAQLGGRPLLGASKTLRGALLMTAGALAATFALARVPAYWRRLPEEVQRAGPLRLGLVLGAGVVLGELPNSFVKRRLGVAAGDRLRSRWGLVLTVWDQADFVPVTWLLLAPIWRMPAREALTSFVGVAAVHVPLNLIGHAIGARDSRF